MKHSRARIGLSLCVLAFALSHSACAVPDREWHTVDLGPYIGGGFAGQVEFRPESATPGEGEKPTVGGVPFHVVKDENGNWRAVDVGLSKWRTMEHDERTLSFYPNWCKANAKDGDLVLHLPKGLYYRAYVLAASADDADTEPVLTLRSGVFRARGFLADATAAVPRWNAKETPAGLTQIAGKIVDNEGETREGRLLVVPVAIPAGKLLKVVCTDAHLSAKTTFDVQLTGRLHTKVSAPDPANFSLMPLGLPSGAQVFGITFERAPVSLLVEGASTWNIFPDARQAVMKLTLENLTDETRKVVVKAQWRRDGRGGGQKPESRAWKVTLGPREHRTLVHEPECRQFGRYAYTVALKDGELGDLLVHHTSFARLPEFADAPLTEALRSRFCVWWWNGAHNTLGADAGLDAVDWLGTGYGAPFGHTKNTGELLKNRGIPGYFDGAAYCFHEFGISGAHMMRYPSLVLEEPRYKLTEKEEAGFKERWDWAVKHCKKIRQEEPHKKIIFGNSSFNGIEEFLYRKFPADLFDYLGHEACGLMRMPERQPELATLQEAYWFRRALEEYGYEKPMTGCHEWLYHSTNPGNHNEQAQADLYVRDMLHGLAYGFDRICPATLEDVGNGYYWSNWGAAGLVTRAPDVHPKLSYVAYAVAAHMVGDADFVRAVDTGSHSAYCLEFSRRRGDKVFACWTLRGQRRMHMIGRFDAGGASLVAQQGNSEPLEEEEEGVVEFDLSPSPVFVTGVTACEGVKLGKPVYAEPPLGGGRVLHALDSLEGWQAVDEASEALDNDNFDMPRQKGKFEVRAVEDEARGGCLEFRLISRGERPPWVPSYQVIGAREPIEIPGVPTHIGLHVRGNSGWGRVNVELRDAKGEKWLSVGMPNAWNANDEMSVSYIIFDGWRWVQIPLPGHYAGGFHWPRFANWRHDDGDGIVDYPLSLTGLVVEQREKIVYVNQMVDASREPVRLSGLTALYANPEVVGDWEQKVLLEGEQR